ncbi:MAG: tRNA pseudouridine(38-40) synthase TruA [Ignavibacteriales bacterium]|nr:tRNA pseudouridine(38-40) synthase TruA [Ignavibacteriales bacterium]MCF8316183.1 tRNA pseudouridine(38-40) synthase TruA [Ignavibacteriales bacterium]MCF8436685.1 tRNA pseudouridine(38-40) synthase TruA [Ignavibacteriales bacterium]
MRFRMTIEYDGTRYSGWQVQKQAKTVQGKLLESAEAVFPKSRIDLQGAGRTDAGVHALAQSAHLDVETNLSSEMIRMRINDNLPPDINILELSKAPHKFHARHSAVSRSYIYVISGRRTAFGKSYVWWIKDRLDIQRMRNASKSFIGMHNYNSFSDPDPQKESTKVNITSVELREKDDFLKIHIEGSHFLWKQVRRMVGTLVEIGRGNFKPGIIGELLNGGGMNINEFTAPPSGLFLEKVEYPGEKQEESRSSLFSLF